MTRLFRLLSLTRIKKWADIILSDCSCEIVRGGVSHNHLYLLTVAFSKRVTKNEINANFSFNVVATSETPIALISNFSDILHWGFTNKVKRQVDVYDGDRRSMPYMGWMWKTFREPSVRMITGKDTDMRLNILERWYLLRRTKKIFKKHLMEKNNGL